MRSRARRATRSAGAVRLLALILAAGAPAAASATDSPARRSYLTANGLLNRGLYDLAAAEYERALEAGLEGEDERIARYGLGVSLFRLERRDEALELLDPLSRTDGFAFAPEAALLSGHCLLRAGRYADAAERFAIVGRDHPEHASAAEAASLRVEALYRAGAHEDAAGAAGGALKRFTEHETAARTAVFGGLALYELERYDEAGGRFRFALEVEPEGPLAAQARLLLAQSLHADGMRGAAIGAYRDVVEAAEHGVETALLGLADLLMAEGEDEDAAAALDRLIREAEGGETRARASVRRARLLFEQGRHEAARRMLDDVSGEAPADLRDDAAYWTAKCALRAGDAIEAAGMFEDALERFPDSELAPEMAFDRAAALSRAGEDEAAARAFASFLEDHPGHRLAADARYGEAAALAGLERWDEALARAQGVLETGGDDDLSTDAALVGAEAAYQLERYEDAEALARAAMETASAGERRDRAAYRLGMSLWRQGRFEEAEPVLAGAVERGAPAAALRALADGCFDAERWADAAAHYEQLLETERDDAARADALLRLGIALARRGEHGEAVARLEEAQRLGDGEVATQAAFERGQSLLASGREGEAVGAFEEALEADPDGRFAAHASYRLGALLRARGETAEAERYLSMASDGEGELASMAAYQRGLAALENGRFGDAARAFEGALVSDPGDDLRRRAAAQRTIALSRSGDLEGALGALDGLTESDFAALPAGVRDTALYERAACLRDLGRTDEALAAYGALAGEASSDAVRAHALLDGGAIRLDRGEAAEGEALLERAAGLIESNDRGALAEQTLYTLGAARLELEDWAGVVEALDGFAARFSGSDLVSSASLLAGEAHLQRGANSRAMTHLERVVEEHPDSEDAAPALLRLGEAAAALQLWSRSEEAFGRFLEVAPEDPAWHEARFGLGWAKENQRRFGEAIEDYRAVVERHGGETAARAQFQIGECLFAQREHEDAVAELLRVDILYAYPEWSAAALYEAGRCLEAMNQHARAREQYRQVVDRFGASRWAEMARERLDEARTAGVPGRGETATSGDGR